MDKVYVKNAKRLYTDGYRQILGEDIRAGDRLRLFDREDTQLSHPTEVMVVQRIRLDLISPRWRVAFTTGEEVVQELSCRGLFWALHPRPEEVQETGS